MNWYGSGFLTIFYYPIFSSAITEENVLLTENNFEILTEDGKTILVDIPVLLTENNFEILAENYQNILVES